MAGHSTSYFLLEIEQLPQLSLLPYACFTDSFDLGELFSIAFLRFLLRFFHKLDHHFIWNERLTDSVPLGLPKQLALVVLELHLES